MKMFPLTISKTLGVLVLVCPVILQTLEVWYMTYCTYNGRWYGH